MKKLSRAGRKSRKSPAMKSPQLLLGIILSGFVLTITFVSFFWTPWDPIGINVEDRLLPPNLSHWFGTDRLGRDLLSQIMVGSQNTLFVALISTILGAVLGTSLGLAAAGSGPRLGAVITRISDIGIALPSILIALVLATTLGPGRLSVIVAISFWFVPVTARVVVGPARQILALDFVEAAMTHGRSRRYILFRQVFPNIAPIDAAMPPALLKNLVSSPDASCRLRRSAIPAVLFSKNLLNLFIRGSAALSKVKNISYTFPTLVA